MNRLIGFGCLVLYFTSAAAFQIEAAYSYTQVIGTNPAVIEISKGKEPAYPPPLLNKEPNHQVMAIESVKLGQANSGKSDAACETKNEQWNSYFSVPKGSAVSIGMCCHRGVDSRWCDHLIEEEEKDKIFVNALVKDSAPFITGSVWPDDPCHMLAREETNKIFGGWITSDPSSGNNLFYTSHFHDFQFMHSMAASAWTSNWKTKKESPEDANTTRHKIQTWAEFAFKVADGTIDARKTLSDAESHLSGTAQRTFHIVFSSYSNRTVAEFFTGWTGAPAEQVRQIAAGSLLHTVQDSFSDSHADRKSFPDKKIKRFSDYKTQYRGTHSLADQAPPELLQPQPLLDYHPISMGAQLLSCVIARATDENSHWDQSAAKIVTNIFERPEGLKQNLAAHPRGYEEKRPRR